MIFGLADAVPTTRVLIDVVYANFAMAVWAAVIVASGEVSARDGRQLAAKSIAAIAFTLTVFALAGAVAVAYQLTRGHADVEWGVYAHGLFFNVGWNACHLALLAVLLDGVIATRWLAATATVAAYAISNLVFDHDLLRFGAPISVWSDIAGYGAQLASHVALGLHWTGLCIALLAGLHLASHGRTPDTVAGAWGGLVVWLLTGAWVLFRPVPADFVVPTVPGSPQPVYSRLDLHVDMQPEDGWLRSRGTAVLVNRHDTAIPDLHFAIPPHLAVASMSLTGDLLTDETVAGFRSYRLNRPLEPRETLKVAFDFERRHNVRFDRLIANGTVLAMADVVPSLGSIEPRTFFEDAPPSAFRVTLGTSLDQTAVAPGTLTRRWKENGAAYFEYQAEIPIRPLTTFHSGRFAVAHRDIGGTPLEIYYHPPHAFAVEAMAAHVRTRSDLPRRVRVVEVPDWRHAVRPPGILGFNWRRAANDGYQPSDANVLSYPERNLARRCPRDGTSRGVGRLDTDEALGGEEGQCGVHRRVEYAARAVDSPCNLSEQRYPYGADKHKEPS